VITDLPLVARLALALDAVLSAPDPAAALDQLWPAHRRPPTPGLADQVAAAEREAHAVLVAEGPHIGSAGVKAPAWADVPPWLRSTYVLAAAQLMLGIGERCRHALTSTGPQPMWVAVWRPELLACRRCASSGVFRLPPGSDADRRCDGCGRVREGDLAPGRLQCGFMTVLYRSCADCRPSKGWA
jgi:hypothetical protein